MRACTASAVPSVSNACSVQHHTAMPNTQGDVITLNTVNSRLADTPLLRTRAITDKILIPGERYRGLTGNDSRYYGLSLLRNYGHFWWYQKNNFIVLTLDKTDTMKFSYDIITYNCSLLFAICLVAGSFAPDRVRTVRVRTHLSEYTERVRSQVHLLSRIFLVL